MKRLPVLFIGHGSPMNAIADNAFTQTLRNLGQVLPRPSAILCISAHWMTEGTRVTHMARPKTIHDFYGFPKALFDVQYPAPGNPRLADQICALVDTPSISRDDQSWGLDHGTWSVLKHIYPDADIPVLQLSLDMSESAEKHFQLGMKLAPLRDQGVLIIGSGNVVHNLRKIDFSPTAKPFDWAVEFDNWVKDQVTSRDFSRLVTDATLSAAGRLSIPTWEHWYPLFYPLGASDAQDRLHFEYEGLEHGSLSMRCLSLGL